VENHPGAGLGAGGVDRRVRHVRQDFIGLFTPAELDTLTALNERVLRHLAGESFPEESTA